MPPPTPATGFLIAPVEGKEMPWVNLRVDLIEWFHAVPSGTKIGMPDGTLWVTSLTEEEVRALIGPGGGTP